MKLTPKLTLIFVLFAAALLGAVSLVGYNVGGAMLESAAVAELQSTAGEKEASLSAWIEEKQADIKALANDSVTIKEAFALKTTPSDSLAASINHNKLVQQFQLRISAGEFTSVMLLDSRSGKILVSTNPSEEGKLKDFRSYFLKGKRGAFITPVYFSQELQAPAITTSAPIISTDGQLLGVLAGRLNLDELNAIIQRRSGMHETDDAFLVNASHQPITQPRFLADPAVLQQGIYTVPVNRCLEEKSGSVFANDYRDVPVIAVYRWLPAHQICLIVKISQTEALAPEHSFGINISLMGLAALLIASLIALALSRTILRPILTLQTAVQRYGRGDVAVRLPETRHDELGSLASEFNTMAATLEEKEKQLRLHSLELEQRVANRTSELEHSQKRFQALIENAPDGIALLGLDGKLRQVTPSTLQILGYTLEDAQGQDPALLTHPDDLPVLLNILNDLLQNPGKVVRAEYRFRHKDGSWHWLESTISNLITEPSIQAIVFNYRDITERKQSEEALSESEEKFKYLFDHSLIGKSITLTDGTLMVNKAFCEMLGYSPDELTNQKWQEITHPEDLDYSNQVVELLLAGEKDSLHLTKRYLHKQGTIVWADVSVSLRRDHAGKPLYFMTALLDITERKRAELQLADALELNERILTSSPVGILTYKFTGECISANIYATKMIGASLEALKAQNFHQLESWKNSGLYALAERAMARRTHTTADIHHISTFGKELWFSAQFVTFKSRGEDLLLLTLGDISERKQAEGALRDSETRYRTLMEKSLEAIYIYELDTKHIVVANPAFLNILGYTADEINHLTLYDIVGHDPDSVDGYLEQVLKEGGVSMGERLWRRKDGTMCPVEVNANRIQQGDKELIFVVGRDITERKQAENAIREKEHLLSEAQRIGHVGSLRFDIVSDTMQFSEETYQLLDILPEKFQHNSKDFLALIYPSDRPGVATWIADVKAGWQIKELDFRIFRRNGEMRYLHCNGAVEFDSEGRPARFIGTMQDVSDHKLAEIQIKQQIKRLTALSEIDRAIISGLGQRRTLEVILSETLSQLQVDAADILLLDPEEQTLSYAAGLGFHTRTYEEIRVRLGEGHAGRIAKEGRLIRVPDLREPNNDPLSNSLIEQENFVSYIGIPLIVQREVRGVLEVFHRTLFQPYQEWLDFLSTLAGQTAIAIENTMLLSNLKTSNQELSQAYDATLEGWSHAMDLRDKETEGHTQRVTDLTVRVARAMGINETQLIHIRRGALLHDIGKLGIPDQILFKPGPLSAEEWEIMQKHPEYAYEMLSPIRYLKPALPIPYFHHEKWDGTGYPLGLLGEQIPLEARIFAVIDVWDALLSDRPYRKAWTVERTLEHIRTLAGSHFDPVVVDCFMRIMKP